MESSYGGPIVKLYSALSYSSNYSRYLQICALKWIDFQYDLCVRNGLEGRAAGLARLRKFNRVIMKKHKKHFIKCIQFQKIVDKMILGQQVFNDKGVDCSFLSNNIDVDVVEFGNAAVWCNIYEEDEKASDSIAELGNPEETGCSETCTVPGCAEEWV